MSQSLPRPTVRVRSPKSNQSDDIGILANLHGSYCFSLYSFVLENTCIYFTQYSMLPSIRPVPVSDHLKNNFNFCDALINFRQTKYSEWKLNISALECKFDGLLARRTLAEGVDPFR